jgi:hypothetical protein
VIVLRCSVSLHASPRLRHLLWLASLSSLTKMMSLGHAGGPPVSLSQLLQKLLQHHPCCVDLVLAAPVDLPSCLSLLLLDPLLRALLSSTMAFCRQAAMTFRRHVPVLRPDQVRRSECGSATLCAVGVLVSRRLVQNLLPQLRLRMKSLQVRNGRSSLSIFAVTEMPSA